MNAGACLVRLVGALHRLNGDHLKAELIGFGEIKEGAHQRPVDADFARLRVDGEETGEVAGGVGTVACTGNVNSVQQLVAIRVNGPDGDHRQPAKGAVQVENGVVVGLLKDGTVVIDAGQLHGDIAGGAVEGVGHLHHQRVGALHLTVQRGVGAQLAAARVQHKLVSHISGKDAVL